MPIPELNGVPVLVTGGAGFIGSHLVDALIECGAKVRVLDNFLTGKRENLAHCARKIDLIEADIRDLDACREACDGMTCLFHEAALGSVPRSMKDPATTFAVNAAGTANVFSAARDARVKRIIYASSSSVYGDSEKLPKREGEEGRPLSPYALSKVENERLAELFHRIFGMEVVGLRYFNVYGPRQDPLGPYAAVVPRFLSAVRDGGTITVFGDGEQARDFTFVKDVVALNLAAARAPTEFAAGRVFNVGRGRPVSVNHLAELALTISGRIVSIVHSAERPGDIRNSTADPSALAKVVGLVPNTSMEAGLAETWARFAASS